jgi:3-deoxy-D-manno-octulosonic-acid transferase
MQVRQAARELPVVQGFADRCKRVLVAGSTWPEEERMLSRYVQEREDVKLVLVPHELHEQHLQQIYQCFEGRYVRYSQATPMSVSMARMLLVDTMGMLSSIYRYGHVAYVGGGFGAGIHNTLEAAVYGMPVVFGPRWKKFREAHGLQEAGAAMSVKNYNEMAAALDVAFEQQYLMGQAAANYVASECGATDIIYNALFNNNP